MSHPKKPRPLWLRNLETEKITQHGSVRSLSRHLQISEHSFRSYIGKGVPFRKHQYLCDESLVRLVQQVPQIPLQDCLYYLQHDRQFAVVISVAEAIKQYRLRWVDVHQAVQSFVEQGYPYYHAAPVGDSGYRLEVIPRLIPHGSYNLIHPVRTKPPIRPIGRNSRSCPVWVKDITNGNVHEFPSFRHAWLTLYPNDIPRMDTRRFIVNRIIVGQRYLFEYSKDALELEFLKQKLYKEFIQHEHNYPDRRFV